MTLGELASSLGVTVLTSVGAAYGGFRWFGTKWLDARFAHRLEAVKLEGQTQLEGIKHEGQRQLEESKQVHTVDLERLKFERADILDRAAKLNQREFEIIPDIWKNTTEAHYAILRLISAWQETPDVGRMTEAQFEACLADSRLENWQKEEIRELDRFKKTTYYADAQEWFRLQDANVAVVAFNRSSANGSIFLHPDTHLKFEAFGDAMRNTYREWGLNRQFRLDGGSMEKRADDAISIYRKNGEDDYQALARYLRERYWVAPQGQAV